MLTVRVTESDIHYSAAQAKMASILEELNFPENVLILIVCLLPVLEDWC